MEGLTAKSQGEKRISCAYGWFLLIKEQNQRNKNPRIQEILWSQATRKALPQMDLIELESTASTNLLQSDSIMQETSTKERVQWHAAIIALASANSGLERGKRKACPHPQKQLQTEKLSSNTDWKREIECTVAVDFNQAWTRSLPQLGAGIRTERAKTRSIRGMKWSNKLHGCCNWLSPGKRGRRDMWENKLISSFPNVPTQNSENDVCRNIAHHKRLQRAQNIHKPIFYSGYSSFINEQIKRAVAPNLLNPVTKNDKVLNGFQIRVTNWT